MTDSYESFEQELLGMSPRSISDKLVDELAIQLNRARRSDRLLKVSMTVGAMAACTILMLLISQIRISPAPSVSINPLADGAKHKNYPDVFAWNDRRMQLENPQENP